MFLLNFYLTHQSLAGDMLAIWRLNTICCMSPETLELEVSEIKNMQVLTEVLQLFLPARWRLEVTSGTIRARCLPRVCQWNMHPDTSASTWRGLFLPPCFWGVWKVDTPMLTLLCPTCHLTFMLDVSSPCHCRSIAPALMPNTMHYLNSDLKLQPVKRSSHKAANKQMKYSLEVNCRAAEFGVIAAWERKKLVCHVGTRLHVNLSLL